MRPGKRAKIRAGFTLIEVLIVIVVLAILMAVALPQYLGAATTSMIDSCRANMQSIADAEQAYRIRNPIHTFTTNLSDLNADLGATPTCPAQGVYTVSISDGSYHAQNGSLVPAGGILIQCSAVGHGVYAPGIDSN